MDTEKSKRRVEKSAILKESTEIQQKVAAVKQAIRDKELVEEQLADLSSAVEKSRAPKLYDDHLVGFELVDSDEDAEEAMGVSVFKVNDQLLYSPGFFISGSYKGDELLYIVDTGMLVPMSNDWIDYITSRDPIELGESEEMDEDLISDPVFDRIGGAQEGSQGPNIAKLSSNSSSLLKECMKEADAKARDSFCSLLLESPELTEHYINNIPGFMEALEYDSTKQAAIDNDTENLFYNLDLDNSDETGVEVYKQTEQWMTDTEKELVLKQGYLIDDNREETDINRLEGTFSVKTLSGYGGKILVDRESGDEVDTIVLKQLNTGKINDECELGKDKKQYSGTSVLITIDASKVYDNNNLSGEFQALAEIADKDSDYRKLVEKLDSEEISVGNSYIALNPNQPECIMLDEVDNIITNTEGGFSKIEACFDSDDIFMVEDSDDKNVHGIDISKQDNTVIFPDNWVVVKIDENDCIVSPEDVFKSKDEVVNEKSRIEAKKAYNSYDIEVEGQKYACKDKREVVETIVKECNLKEKDAEKIWSDFENYDREVYFIKEAQPMPAMDMGGMGMPPMGDMMMGEGGGGEVDPEVQRFREIAEEALAEGHTEVVDLAGLSKLLTASESGNLINKYVGEVLSGVNSLGSILFLLYSDYSNYEEEIGVDDLEDIISHAKEAFELLGDVVLELKDLSDQPGEVALF